MYNLDKKQKMIAGIIIAIIVGFICYYVYAKDENTDTQIELENNLEIQSEEEQTVYSDDKILVHVSGAVNKEGIVELKPNARISDAIEKARRGNRRCLCRGY